MQRHNIRTLIAPDVAIDPAAAGQTAVNGKVIDLRGFESALFLVSFGAITAGAVTGVKIQAGSASDGSDMADVTGASVSVPDTASNKGAISVEVHRLMKRYARVVVTRATQNSVVNGGFVLLGRSGVEPPALRPNIGAAPADTLQAPSVLVSPA